jgi:tetratricopeptide (TPR) repeat protein
VLVLLSLPTAAHADIAPPAQPPGSNPQPGAETTQVRMVAETVLIDVTAGASSVSLGQARVTADFTMRNLGSTAESMAVRFPLGANDGWSRIKEIAGMRVKVGGHQVVTHRIEGEDPYSMGGAVPWTSFDVTFRPGEDVQVEVQYVLEASGEYPFIWFKYVLASGAGWKDSIGSADIIVRLPYDANDENILFDNPGFTMFGTTLGGMIEGRSIRWHYDDLEPTTTDNFEVNLVMPSAWQKYLTEQDNIRSNPADGEAWGRLGKVCKEMAFSSRGKGFRAGGELDAGGARLYEEGLAAYEKAVTLLPNDALWHAGYADALAYHAYFVHFGGADVSDEALHALREIQAALELAPKDAKVQEIAERISWSFPDGMTSSGDGYHFPWLTATPTALPPTATEPPTQVSQIVPTATTQAELPTTAAPPAATEASTSAAPSKPSLPVCGGALLLPLALIGGAVARSRGRKMTR